MTFLNMSETKWKSFLMTIKRTKTTTLMTVVNSVVLRERSCLFLHVPKGTNYMFSSLLLLFLSYLFHTTNCFSARCQLSLSLSSSPISLSFFLSILLNSLSLTQHLEFIKCPVTEAVLMLVWVCMSTICL